MFQGGGAASASLVELGLGLLRVGLEGRGEGVHPSIALVVDIDDFLVNIISMGPGYAEGVRDRAFQAIQTAAAPWGTRVLAVPFDLDEFAIFLAPDARGEAAEAEAAALAVAVLNGVRRDTGYSVGIGVGGYHPEAGGLVDSFKEALAALRYKLVLGGGRAFLHRELERAGLESAGCLPAIGSDHLLWQKIRQGDVPGVEQIIHRWLREAERCRNVSPEALEAQVAEMVLHSLQVAKESGVNLLQSSDAARQLDELRYLTKIHEFSCLAQWLEGYFRQVVQAIARTDQTAYDPVAKARTIIHERYSENLTLAAVAHEVYVSPFHLSHLFRRVAGVTFLEYLTEYRLQQAKAYLEESREPVEVVAAKVGYSDPRHFSKVFKRLVGVTPTQYRLRRLAGA